jgi:hypothetical protein
VSGEAAPRTLTPRARRLLFSGAAAIVLISHLIFQAAHAHDSQPGFTQGRQWTAMALVLLLIAWILYRLRRNTAAYSVMVFLILDVALGGVSGLLRRQLGGTLLPTTLQAPDSDHSLLGGANRPNASGRRAFVQGIAPVYWRHDHYGYRMNTDPSFTRPTAIVIGGSTTYDIGVSNGQTWVDDLQRQDSNVEFINAGVIAYSSLQHVIQTAFYLPRSPSLVCAVYYLGWNDLRKSFVPSTDSAFADASHFQDWWPPSALPAPFGSPVMRLLVRLWSRVTEPSKPVNIEALPVRHGVDERSRRQLARNVATIVAMNRAKGLRSVFIGHLLNYDVLKGSGTRTAMMLVPDSEARFSMTAFNAAIANAAAQAGGAYLAVPADSFRNADFIDAGHFSVRGASKFAGFVGSGVHHACFTPAG